MKAFTCALLLSAAQAAQHIGHGYDNVGHSHNADYRVAKAGIVSAVAHSSIAHARPLLDSASDIESAISSKRSDIESALSDGPILHGRVHGGRIISHGGHGRVIRLNRGHLSASDIESAISS